MSALKLYLLSQDHNTDYDSYDSCVVVASSIEEARAIRPGGSTPQPGELDYTWCSPDGVKVQELGVVTDETLKAGFVVCASFNAG